MMILILLRLSMAALLFAGVAVQAQTVAQPSPGAVATVQRPADFIVAVVNSEPITNQQLRFEVQRVARQLEQTQGSVPDSSELSAQVLERLIGERAQLQLAREIGIKIDDAAVDEAELSVARQNQLDVAQVYRRLEADGISRTLFRNQLREQLMLLRVREREVVQKVRVSELEIDQYLAERQKTTDIATMQLDLAHVLIALPDEPTAIQVIAAQDKAQRVLERARAREDFATLARELSQAADASSGGQLGRRPADRFPALFVDAVRDLAVGDMTLVRSGAGFHVLKLVEKRAPGMPASITQQTRASHILLRPSAQLTESAARERLLQLRQRVLAGQADFGTLARENSVDASAAQNGDLGWASPGAMVAEFEDVMNTLAPGQISEPLVSRFGMHLILVTDRRTVSLSLRETRDAVRGILREKKIDDAVLTWAQDVRARAYVEIRQPPT